MAYSQYEHHGATVWVRNDLKGKHREHCECYSCEKFVPMDRAANCPRANLIYAICVMLDMVLPVWECPDFSKRDRRSGDKLVHEYNNLLKAGASDEILDTKLAEIVAQCH